MRAEDGGQRELVHRWFTETQAPLFLRDGTFPDWFKGFAARRYGLHGDAPMGGEVAPLGLFVCLFERRMFSCLLLCSGGRNGTGVLIKVLVPDLLLTHKCFSNHPMMSLIMLCNDHHVTSLMLIATFLNVVTRILAQ